MAYLSCSRECVAGCGGVFNEMTGELVSPNYPENYEHNTECIWEVHVPEGYHVIMSANGIFDVPSGGSNDCPNDYLEFSSINDDGVAVSTSVAKKLHYLPHRSLTQRPLSLCYRHPSIGNTAVTKRPLS